MNRSQRILTTMVNLTEQTKQKIKVVRGDYTELTKKEAKLYLELDADGLNIIKTNRYDYYIYVPDEETPKKVQFIFVDKGDNVANAQSYSEDNWDDVEYILDLN